MLFIYGEAGAGKTVLALEAVRTLCSRQCLYITTEGLDFLKRAASIGINLRNLVVYEAFDLNDIVEALNMLLAFGNSSYKIIVVDSVNAPFRNEAVHPEAVLKLMYIVAALQSISAARNIPVILTGQVHSVDNGLEAVGINVMRPWLDCIARVLRLEAKGYRMIVFEECERKLPYTVCCFRITSSGVNWLSRCP